MNKPEFDTTMGLMMDTEKTLLDLDKGGRRSGLDRRRYSYTGHIPERRSGDERRNGQDRRSGADRRESTDRRSVEVRDDFMVEQQDQRAGEVQSV